MYYFLHIDNSLKYELPILTIAPNRKRQVPKNTLVKN